MIDAVGGNVQTGKEGTVLSAVRGEEEEEEWFCIKVYKVLTMEFRNKKEYIYGDYRFNDLEGVSSSDSKIVREWTRKEHFNLLKLFEAGIPCPEPVLYDKNVLLMRMIGDRGQPAPSLKQCLEERPEMYKRLLLQALQLLRDMFQKCRLIHGDFSEYNLLCGSGGGVRRSVHHGRLFVIDVGQSVNTIHDKWREFLSRDVHNIIAYFNHKQPIPDVEEIEEQALEYVLNEEDNGLLSKVDALVQYSV